MFLFIHSSHFICFSSWSWPTSPFSCHNCHQEQIVLILSGICEAVNPGPTTSLKVIYSWMSDWLRADGLAEHVCPTASPWPHIQPPRNVTAHHGSADHNNSKRSTWWDSDFLPDHARNGRFNFSWENLHKMFEYTWSGFAALQIGH